MKAASVSIRLIREHRRMDARYYLSGPEKIDEKIETAKETLRKTATRIRNLRKERAELLAKQQEMIASGDLVPLEPAS